jgi:N-acyl-D-aspartate/D-glutamate deacylase
MAQMSIHADRALNWNVLAVMGNNKESNDRQLAASDYAAARGGKVVALTLPDTLRTRLSFKAGFVLDILANWAPVMTLPDDEKMAYLADPDKRRQLDEWAQSCPPRNLAHWAAYTIVEAFGPDTKRFEGRQVGDIAEEQGKRPFDALLDIVLEDRLLTSITAPDRGQTDQAWERRLAAWRDPRTLVGASDAGAHVDMIDSFSLSTILLGKAFRQRGLLPVEEAVQLLSDAPARFYGLRERGRLEPGFHADVVVFDPTTVGSGPLHTRFDLPGGAGRLYADADGIEHVFVNGTEVVQGRELTGARPGTVLRSGRDTETVSVSGHSA